MKNTFWRAAEFEQLALGPGGEMLEIAARMKRAGHRAWGRAAGGTSRVLRSSRLSWGPGGAAERFQQGAVRAGSRFGKRASDQRRVRRPFRWSGAAARARALGMRRALGSAPPPGPKPPGTLASELEVGLMGRKGHSQGLFRGVGSVQCTVF